jgi:hypothetical protein
MSAATRTAQILKVVDSKAKVTQTFKDMYEARQQSTESPKGTSMVCTPNEIKLLLENIPNSTGKLGCHRSGGNRWTCSIKKVAIVNHLVPSSNAAGACGYILLNNIPEGTLTPTERELSGKTSLGISHLTFGRLLELLGIIIQNI